MEFIIAKGQIIVRDVTPGVVELEIKNLKGDRVQVVTIAIKELKRLAAAL